MLTARTVEIGDEISARVESGDVGVRRPGETYPPATSPQAVKSSAPSKMAMAIF